MAGLIKYLVKISFFIFISITVLTSQRGEVLVDPEIMYNEAIRSFETGNFHNAELLFTKYQKISVAEKGRLDLFPVEAMLYQVRIAYDNDLTNADELLKELEQKVPDHIMLHEAYLAQGNYYFRQNNYTEAIKTFTKIRQNLLNREATHNVKFKLAYSYFVKKRFNEAATLFEELSFVKNEYYFTSNYYLGICQFLRSDFSDAINSFKIVENTKEYKPHIPYYLVQLYFTQDNLETTIEYGEEQLKLPGLKNKTKIHHVVGASYFIKGEYALALPHFKEYEQNTEKLNESDFYQLGYINYQLGKWNEAIPHFLEISDVDGAFGQNANYYLADCYLRTGEKLSARTALKKVSDFKIENNMTEESMLNFGKLSAEMGYDKEAIDALFNISSNSLYFNEAQDILGELFVQTNDYATAQSILESRDEVSHQLFEAYQKVCYFKGIQSLQNDDEYTAIEDFTKAIKTDRDLAITAQSYYWLAEIAQRQEKYLESSHRLIKYFLLIKGVEEIAGQAAPSFAHYVQGYNYIKLDQYQAALDEFKACLNILPATTSVNQEQKNKVLINSKLRAGDCALKTRKYDEALEHYQFIIDRKSRFSPYALFQKAIIQHLTKNVYGAISILQSIIQNYPKSDMVGISLMHLGDMYTELNEPTKAYDAYLGLVNSELNGISVQNKAYLKLGLLAYNMGDIEKSSGFYKDVLQNNPSGNERKEALDALEEIYINDLNRAGEYLTLAKEMGGVTLANLYQDSITYVAAKRTYDKDSLKLAVIGFDTYLENYPRGYFAVEAHFFRGKSLVFTKSYKEAYSDFQYIIQLGEGEYYGESCNDAAILAFNYLNDFNKSYEYYQILEGLPLDENKEYEAQLGALRSAFRVNSLNGVQKFADKILNSKLATDKEKSSAQYYIGKVAYSHEKYDLAIRAFNRVISSFKNSNLAAEARFLIANIYFQRGEFGLAEDLCKNANTFNSAYPYWIAKSLILLSDILVKKDDLFNARAALEATIENYKEDSSIFNEANSKLQRVIELQNEQSRLEKDNKDGTIKMDTIDE